MVGDLDMPFAAIHSSSQQKISKDTVVDINSAINQFVLIDICRIPMTAEYMLVKYVDNRRNYIW